MGGFNFNVIIIICGNRILGNVQIIMKFASHYCLHKFLPQGTEHKKIKIYDVA